MPFARGCVKLILESCVLARKGVYVVAPSCITAVFHKIFSDPKPKAIYVYHEDI